MSSPALKVPLLLIDKADFMGSSSFFMERSPWEIKIFDGSSYFPSSPDFRLILWSNSKEPILKNLHNITFTYV